MAQIIQFPRNRKPRRKPRTLSEWDAQVEQLLRIVNSGKKRYRRVPVYLGDLDPVS